MYVLIAVIFLLIGFEFCLALIKFAFKFLLMILPYLIPLICTIVILLLIYLAFFA